MPNKKLLQGTLMKYFPDCMLQKIRATNTLLQPMYFNSKGIILSRLSVIKSKVTNKHVFHKALMVRSKIYLRFGRLSYTPRKEIIHWQVAGSTRLGTHTSNQHGTGILSNGARHLCLEIYLITFQFQRRSYQRSEMGRGSWVTIKKCEKGFQIVEFSAEVQFPLVKK